MPNTSPESPLSELPQDAQVVLPERPDLGDSVPELGRTLDAAAESEPRPLLGVDPDVQEDLRVDHPGSAQLDPAGVLAHATPLHVADRARDIGLARRVPD